MTNKRTYRTRIPLPSLVGEFFTSIVNHATPVRVTDHFVEVELDCDGDEYALAERVVELRDELAALTVTNSESIDIPRPKEVSGA